MNHPISIKPGDTYELVCALKIDGIAQDLSDVNISSQVRTLGGVVVWDCVVDKLADEYGSLTLFRISATPEMTRSAPIGALESDIKYEFRDGTVATTPTFILNSTQRITV